MFDRARGFPRSREYGSGSSACLFTGQRLPQLWSNKWKFVWAKKLLSRAPALPPVRLLKGAILQKIRFPSNERKCFGINTDGVFGRHSPSNYP